MRNEIDVDVGIRRAAEGVNGSYKISTLRAKPIEPDSPFPFLEAALMKAKESPWVVLSIICGVSAIVVGAIVSFTVGFGIFLFNLNGTMHEMKAQQATTNTELVAIKKQGAEQSAEFRNQLNEQGNIVRAYEAANGKRIEFMVGLMSPDRQRAMNNYDKAHPLPRIPRPPLVNEEN